MLKLFNQFLETGRHLSEHCKDEYPKSVTYCLWILAELSIIAADIPQGLPLIYHIYNID